MTWQSYAASTIQPWFKIALASVAPTQRYIVEAYGVSWDGGVRHQYGEM